MKNIFLVDTENVNITALSSENKLDNVDNMINKFIEKGFRPKTAVKMTLILAGAKSFIDAQDRFLIEFGGNFTVLYKCIDVLEEYYNEKSNINETV